MVEIHSTDLMALFVCVVLILVQDDLDIVPVFIVRSSHLANGVPENGHFILS